MGVPAINEYLFEDRPDSSFLRMMEKEGADVMLFGHTHKPFHKKMVYEDDGIAHYPHAVNIGSVGKPKDGDIRACYALFTINEEMTTADENFVEVEIRRCKYDVEKTAGAIEESLLPNAFANMLRKAY